MYRAGPGVWPTYQSSSERNRKMYNKCLIKSVSRLLAFVTNVIFPCLCLNWCFLMVCVPIIHFLVRTSWHRTWQYVHSSEGVSDSTAKKRLLNELLTNWKPTTNRVLLFHKETKHCIRWFTINSSDPPPCMHTCFMLCMQYCLFPKWSVDSSEMKSSRVTCLLFYLRCRRYSLLFCTLHGRCLEWLMKRPSIDKLAQLTWVCRCSIANRKIVDTYTHAI